MIVMQPRTKSKVPLKEKSDRQSTRILLVSVYSDQDLAIETDEHNEL